MSKKYVSELLTFEIYDRAALYFVFDKFVNEGMTDSAIVTPVEMDAYLLSDDYRKQDMNVECMKIRLMPKYREYYEGKQSKKFVDFISEYGRKLDEIINKPPTK